MIRLISPNVRRKFFGVLLLSRNPVKRESPYTWIGKRYIASLEMIDAIENFFTPKNHWSKRAFDFCVWEAETLCKR